MNREIKFRGKRVDNGEWVYGNLIITKNRGTFIKSSDDDKIFGSGIEVQPETVGQYTGLKDRDGKEIYEGDFVCLGSSDFGFIQTKDNKPVLYEVKHEKCDFILYRNDINLRWGKLSRVEELYWQITHSNNNIYDNPELINSQNEKQS